MRLFGFRLSPEYIEQAKKRYPKARFVCERVSQFSIAEEQSFDLVLALGIVHHLDDAEARQLFQLAYHALKLAASWLLWTVFGRTTSLPGRGGCWRYTGQNT